MTLKHLVIIILILLFAAQKLSGSTISEKWSRYITEHRKEAQAEAQALISTGDTV